MTTPATTDLCRLTVCGPDTVVEVAVPAQAPLADLLPALVGYLGGDLADAGLEHGGWVLQRLGDAPLDEDRSVLAQVSDMGSVSPAGSSSRAGWPRRGGPASRRSPRWPT